MHNGKIMRKRVSRKMASTGCGVFLVLCIGIKADPVGQVSMNPFAKMSIQQIELEYPVKFVAALPSGTGTPATATITSPPASGGMNQIPWNPSAIFWVFQEEFYRMPYVDIPIIVEVLESPSSVEFSTAQLAAGSEARYLSEQNLLQKSPPVQERETDPQPIAEWCAGTKPGEDDQHQIVDGWDTLLRKYGRDMREFYSDLHFVRGKPITLVFRVDIHAWCWSADYVVGLKNNRWVPNPNSPNVKDATDLVMDAFIYVRQGTIFDAVLNWDGLRDAKGNYPGL
jgi:hypothetical protein